jgi:hypothetical protein
MSASTVVADDIDHHQHHHNYHQSIFSCCGTTTAATTTNTPGNNAKLDDGNCYNDDDDDNYNDDIQSQTSQDDALCEVLGLPSLKAIVMTTLEMETETTTAEENNNQQQKQCSIERISSLPRNVSRHGIPPSECYAYRIAGLFTRRECQQLIHVAAFANNKFDYVTTATHTAIDPTTGEQSSYEIRLTNPNPHKLSVFHHPPSVGLIRSRLLPYLQNNGKCVYGMSCDKVAGINPRLRILKYDSADEDEFRPHFDATTTTTTGSSSSTTTTSALTVLIYLNDGGGVDFDGGETMFLSNTVDGSKKSNNGRTDSTDSSHRTVITPTAGSVVIFDHDLYHSGCPLRWGTKYVLRTDIMYNVSSQQLDDLRKHYYQKYDNDERNNKDDNNNNKSSSTNNGNGSSTVSSVPTTVKELVHGFVTKRRDDDTTTTTITDSTFYTTLQEGLMSLGLWDDTTIETFCTPGRFALQAMLQDVLMGTAANATTSSDDDDDDDDDDGGGPNTIMKSTVTSSTVTQLIDAAFDAKTKKL